MRYIIQENESGKTVKDVLLCNIGISVSFLRTLKFIENGIMLNGAKVTVRKQVLCGDVLDIAVEDEREGSRLTPTELSVDVIYEDSELVVPSKPANMPTHPSRDHHGDTLADALAYRYRDSSLPFVFRPINRLDRNTSGHTLIARNRISASKLSRRRSPEKSGTIKTHIRRTVESIIVREVCDESDGDYALTRYTLLAERDGRSLVLASPETGRTHQLRVHFAHIGCAILGDDMYGGASDLIERHALHAALLSFPHPSDDRELTLLAPLPDDMKELATRLFDIDTDELVGSRGALI